MSGNVWTLALAAGLLAGCSTSADRYDRTQVSAGLEERSGHRIGPGDGSLPPGVVLEDGLREDEAVALALWNNAAYQEALAELGLRRADLIQAGMIPNPSLQVLFPLGPKQLEFTARFPLEVLWLRPGRVAIAELDCERVSALLVQGGLDLVRDVRIGFADLRLARSRAEVARDMVAAREQLSQAMEARLRAGDVSELDAAAARVDVLRARADGHRAARDEAAARERLRTLVGLAQDPRTVDFTDGLPEPARPGSDLPFLLQKALAVRPDLRSAELAIDAAVERMSLAEIEFLTFTGLADGNGSGKKGFEAGPGVDVPLPIFNQNQGGQSKAEAEFERATRHQRAVRDRIALEVRESHAAVLAAIDARAAQQEALPILESAVRQAERSEKAGDVPPQAVVESRLRLFDGRLRDAEAAAEIRRANAQLERSVGGRLP